MSEIRYNPISGDWVIVAAERQQRPSDFTLEEKTAGEIPAWQEGCPFCPGNEKATPTEISRIDRAGAWRVRVVPNKFPTLDSTVERRDLDTGLRHTLAGAGRHEVIIEHPRHDLGFASMEPEDIAAVLSVYRERCLDAEADKRVEAVVLFKNHGARAGTSLQHPHSQLIATPIVPPQLKNRVRRACHFMDHTGHCIFCQILASELSDKVRIIQETDSFVSFIPYAAISPLHTWVLPRRHTPSFTDISPAETADLGRHLHILTRRMTALVSRLSYNLMVRTLPTTREGAKAFHWYISIVPRLGQAAGFELGSGMFVNPFRPTDSAYALRQVRID